MQRTLQSSKPYPQTHLSMSLNTSNFLIFLPLFLPTRTYIRNHCSLLLCFSNTPFLWFLIFLRPELAVFLVENSQIQICHPAVPSTAQLLPFCSAYLCIMGNLPCSDHSFWLGMKAHYAEVPFFAFIMSWHCTPVLGAITSKASGSVRETNLSGDFMFKSEAFPTLERFQPFTCLP